MYMCWHKCSCDVCPRTHGRITECEDRARILEQNSQLSWIQVLCDVNVSRILEAKEWEFQRWLNSHAWLKTLWSGQAPWTISLWIISKGNHKNYHSHHIIVIISHHCHHITSLSSLFCFFSSKKYSFRTVRLGATVSVWLRGKQSVLEQKRRGGGRGNWGVDQLAKLGVVTIITIIMRFGYTVNRFLMILINKALMILICTIIILILSMIMMIC